MCNKFIFLRRRKMRKLNKILVLCSLALVFTVLFADVSFAQGTSVMDTATGKAVGLFTHVKTIIFVVGGFGLVGIAFQAIFGKVKWTWFAGLAVGLGILAAASAIINYATGADVGAGHDMQDTFLDAGTGTM